MKLYKHNTTNELIEFVGLNSLEYVFRYIGPEFKSIYFHIPNSDVIKYWSPYDNPANPT